MSVKLEVVAVVFEASAAAWRVEDIFDKSGEMSKRAMNKIFLMNA